MPSPVTVAPRILSHPWYRKWERGELPADSLRVYAREYYWQVARFPRYLSRVHSQLPELGQRQAILANLAEEENPASPHPELWLDFAEALGLDREEIRGGAPGPAARELTEAFQALVDAGPAEGLGALLAYESQVPDVARFKARALAERYLDGERLARGARFFKVHEEADVWHTESLERIVATLPAGERAAAQEAADRACLALWRFLDAMDAMPN